MTELPSTLTHSASLRLESCLQDLLPEYRYNWECGPSYPDGKRWTITDGTGSDWGIVEIVGTKEEAEQICAWANERIDAWNARISR